MKRLLERIHQSWLLVGICVGVLAGTILALVCRWTFFASPLWLVFGLILFLFAFFRPNRFFFILLIAVGIIFAFYRTSSNLIDSDYLNQFVGQTSTISGKILSDPTKTDSELSFTLTDLNLNGESLKGTIFVKMGSTDAELQRSDLVTLTGKLASGFGSYSAAFYRPTLTSWSRPSPGDLFLELRNWFAAKIRQYIPDTESSLGLAYLLGLKSGLPDSLNEMLRLVGLTHLVVASGTHLGIIVGWAKRLFGRLSRFAGVLFSILFILIFGGIIGWTASITRAAIVTILSLLAWYVGRKFAAWRILLLTAALTLLINPMYLIDLGWLLSFASFAGIMLLTPVITQFFYGQNSLNDQKLSGKIASILIATISAQLLCIPIMIYFFGTISLISVLANLLILPTVPLVMGLTFLTGLANFLPILSTIFGKIATFLLDYHLSIINFFSAQKMFLIEIPSQNPLIFLLYLPILAPFLIFFLKSQKQKRDARNGIS